MVVSSPSQQAGALSLNIVHAAALMPLIGSGPDKLIMQVAEQPG